MSEDKPHTSVILAYRKNRTNHRLLFGEPVLRVRRGWRRELAAFEPGQIFGYERWQANQYGTQSWRIAICMACNAGSLTQFPGIMPGIILLLDANGRTRIKRMLAMLDELKAWSKKGLCDVPEHQWRTYANAIETRESINQERFRA